MTAHELARKLLEHPDLPAIIAQGEHDNLQEVRGVFKEKVTTYDTALGGTCNHANCIILE